MINYSDSFKTQYTVNVTIKHVSKFGIKYERLGDFVFCARSREDAIDFAGPFTRGAMRSIDTTKIVKVVESVPVPEIDPFAGLAQPLKSLLEVESENREAAA